MLLGMLAAAAILGADLNAPIVPAQPTIGSEILRGADAGFDCQEGNPLDDGAFLGCIESRQSDNRQKMGRGYEAFDAGLWFEASQHLQSAVRAGAMVQSDLDVADAGLRAAERAIGVTDGDVVRASQHP